MKPIIQEKRIQQSKSDTDPAEECRSPAEMPGEKTGILYRECLSEENKSGHNRTMAPVPAGLSVLVNRPDQEPMNRKTQDIFTDVRGFSYQTVRFCDLDRICDK